MTELQYALAVLIIKEIMQGGARLNKVSEMSDDDCRAAIPLVQARIDKNDETIMGL